MVLWRLDHPLDGPPVAVPFSYDHGTATVLSKDDGRFRNCNKKNTSIH